MAGYKVYNAHTKKWETAQGPTLPKKSKKTKAKVTKNNKKDDDSGMSNKSTDKKSASGKTEKKVNRKTIRTLEGQIEYVPNKTTIKINVADTIKLSNLGKYLSGKYYVSNITRTIDSSGYHQTATVLKTNFRKSLKVVSKKTTIKKKK